MTRKGARNSFRSCGIGVPAVKVPRPGPGGKLRPPRDVPWKYHQPERLHPSEPRASPSEKGPENAFALQGPTKFCVEFGLPLQVEMLLCVATFRGRCRSATMAEAFGLNDWHTAPN